VNPYQTTLNSNLQSSRAEHLMAELQKLLHDKDIQLTGNLKAEIAKMFIQLFSSLGKPVFEGHSPRPDQPLWSKEWNKILRAIDTDIRTLFTEAGLLGSTLVHDFNYSQTERERLKNRLRLLDQKLATYTMYSRNTNMYIGRYKWAVDTFESTDLIDLGQTDMEISKGVLLLKRSGTATKIASIVSVSEVAPSILWDAPAEEDPPIYPFEGAEYNNGQEPPSWPDANNSSVHQNDQTYRRLMVNGNAQDYWQIEVKVEDTPENRLALSERLPSGLRVHIILDLEEAQKVNHIKIIPKQFLDEGGQTVPGFRVLTIETGTKVLGPAGGTDWVPITKYSIGDPSNICPLGNAELPQDMIGKSRRVLGGGGSIPATNNPDSWSNSGSTSTPDQAYGEIDYYFEPRDNVSRIRIELQQDVAYSDTVKRTLYKYVWTEEYVEVKGVKRIRTERYYAWSTDPAPNLYDLRQDSAKIGNSIDEIVSLATAREKRNELLENSPGGTLIKKAGGKNWSWSGGIAGDYEGIEAADTNEEEIHVRQLTIGVCEILVAGIEFIAQGTLVSKPWVYEKPIRELALYTSEETYSWDANDVIKHYVRVGSDKEFKRIMPIEKLAEVDEAGNTVPEVIHVNSDIPDESRGNINSYIDTAEGIALDFTYMCVMSRPTGDAQETPLLGEYAFRVKLREQ